MNRNQLKNLIPNKPSKKEIEKFVKFKEIVKQYVKYNLCKENKNIINILTVSFYMNVIVTIFNVQNSKIIFKLDTKIINIIKNYFKKTKENRKKTFLYFLKI